MRRVRALAVFVIATASLVLTPLVADAVGPVFTGTVAIQSFRDGQGEIYIVTPTTQTNLTNNPADDDDPAWSPDGSKIAFKSTRGGNADIWVVNADGSSPVNLTNTAGDEFYPTWSADGAKIAFHSDRDGNHEIYVMDADGTDQTRLTNDPGLDVAARFSPDGSKIAFVSARSSGNIDVWVMDANGANPTRITTDTALDHFPGWSPDGSQIAFASTRGGAGFEIYTMNANGTGVQQLTSDGVQSNTPAYSPNGSQMAFQRDMGGNVETFVMAASGGDFTRLTIASGLDGDPDWKPPTPPDNDPPETTITGGPAQGSSTTSTSATFTFTSDESGSTFSCKLDSGAAQACNSGSKSYSTLSTGSHTFTVTATDAAGNADPTPASRTWTVTVSGASTTLNYTGGQIVAPGSSFNAKAKLIGTGCATGKSVAFSLDRDPDGGGSATPALGSATTNANGVATRSVSTAGWQSGVYSITATFAGAAGCGPSSIQATLTVTGANDVADGGGWITVSGSGRVNFGFTLKQGNTGQFRMINPGRWRLIGTLSTFTQPGGVPTSTGTGDLSWWNASLNGGLGDWVPSQSGVSFTIKFEDRTPAAVQPKPDRFAVTSIGHTVQPGEPSPMPTSTLKQLQAGRIDA